MDYGTTITIALGFDEAVERTRAALADQGFGVLTEIDVQATLRKKLGVEMERYLILGACNPTFAHQALGGIRDDGSYRLANGAGHRLAQIGAKVAGIEPVGDALGNLVEHHLSNRGRHRLDDDWRRRRRGGRGARGRRAGGTFSAGKR